MREPSDNRERILAAAIRCFEDRGMHKTSMTDIGEAAGLSRKTVYRTFSDRGDLLLAIADRQIHCINALVNDRLQRCTTLEQALVDGIAFTVQATKSDALFHAVVSEATDRSIESLIIDANEEIREVFARSWRPLIERARAVGELKSSLSDARLIEGIRNFVALLVVRSDHDEGHDRQFLRDFLVPAIMGRTP